MFGSYGVLKTGGFDAALVKRIKIDAGGGGDVIEHLVSGKTIPTTINGGKGDDRITTMSRRATLLGGSGNDTLVSHQAIFRLTQFGGDGTLFYNGITTTTLSPNFDWRARAVPLSTFGSASQRGIVRDSEGRFTISPSLEQYRVNVTNGNIVYGPNGQSFTYVTRDLHSPFNGSGEIPATGNRLEGGDGDDKFETYGSEDTIVGGNGKDSYIAPVNGIDVYEETNLTPITPTKDVVSIRSRLAAFGVEEITTKRPSNFGSVTVSGGSLADLA